LDPLAHLLDRRVASLADSSSVDAGDLRRGACLKAGHEIAATCTYTLAIGLLFGCGSSRDQSAGTADKVILRASRAIETPKPASGRERHVGFGATTAPKRFCCNRAGRLDANGSPTARFAMRDATPDPCVEAGTCPPGVWVNVTPAAWTQRSSGRRKTRRPGSIVGDPARPTDLYVGGSSAGLWKSSDYGSTWSRINSTLPDVPRGVTIALPAPRRPRYGPRVQHDIQVD